jgi:hypothetical protein
MAKNKNDHWKDIGTSRPEKEPGQNAQDKSLKPPTKDRQEEYEKAGEAGQQYGKTFKKPLGSIRGH